MFGASFLLKNRFRFITCLIIINIFLSDFNNIIADKIELSPENLEQKSVPAVTQATSVPAAKRKARTITIFVHGSILKLPILWRAKKGCVNGLVQYSDICDECGYKKVLKHLNEVDPNNYRAEDNYMFGWSGSLRSGRGEEASIQLYDQLAGLVEEYKNKYGYIPNIRIITHSNGARIALYLGKTAKRRNNKNFRVQEVIMLACPVQHITSKLIPQRCFRKIYSLYSLSDWVQIIAPQSYKKFKKKECKKCLSPFFSSRFFPDYPNLIQAKIRVNNRGISHSGFLRHKFIRKLPQVINELDNLWDNPTPSCEKNKPCSVIMVKV